MAPVEMIRWYRRLLKTGEFLPEATLLGASSNDDQESRERMMTEAVVVVVAAVAGPITYFDGRFHEK